MANIMQRKFTLRERILMLVLVGILLIGLYFLLVYYPVQRRLDDLAAKNDELALKEDVARAREVIYDSMKAELDEIAKMDQDEVTEIPAFDNSDNLLEEIYGILQKVAGHINVNTVSQDGSIYVRTVSLSFTIGGFASEEFETDYAKTKQVIYELTHIQHTVYDETEQKDVTHKYRSLMNGLNVSGSGDVTADDSLTVSCTLTFYERQV